MWSTVAGGPVFYSANGTSGTKLAAVGDGVVLPVTHQQFMSNHSSIEFVAIGDGTEFVLDVRRCHYHGKNSFY